MNEVEGNAGLGGAETRGVGLWARGGQVEGGEVVVVVAVVVVVVVLAVQEGQGQGRAQG